MLLGHLYIIFEELSDLLPIFNWVVYFSLLSFKSYFCILESSTLSDMSSADIFYPSVWLVFLFSGWFVEL